MTSSRFSKQSPEEKKSLLEVRILLAGTNTKDECQSTVFVVGGKSAGDCVDETAKPREVDSEDARQVGGAGICPLFVILGLLAAPLKATCPRITSGDRQHI